MDLAQFFLTYFWNPIFTGEGYNIYNTVVYAVLLIAALYAVLWALKRMGVKFDKKLFRALLPYVFLGGIVRVLEDFAAFSGIAKNALLITPGIYVTLFVFTIVILFACKHFFKDWHKKFETVGWGCAALALFTLIFWASGRTLFLKEAFIVLALASIATVALLFVLNKLKIFSPENGLLCWAHMLDGFATAVAIAFLGYGEQHVVSALIVGTSPWLFPIVKAVVVVAVVWVFENQPSEKQWYWMLKFAVLTLGLAPGVRDVLRMLIGV